jgi:O-antigen ligase
MQRNIPIIDKMLTFTLFSFTASSMFSISISQVTAGLGGILWLLRTHLTDTWKEQRWPLGIPFTLFVLACFIAVANAYDISSSYESLKKLLEFLIFFWVLNCVRDNNLRNSLALVLIASATIVSLFGFFQAFQYTPASINDMFHLRVEGTQSTYMTFAGLLMLVSVLALAHVLFFRPMQKWVLASIVIIFFCLLLTLTRQAWLGFFVGVIFLTFFWRKKFLLLLPLLLVITFLISPSATKHRMIEPFIPKAEIWLDEGNYKMLYESESENEQDLEIYQLYGVTDWNLASRINLWQFGWKVFKDYPLTGCGFRCLNLIHNQYIDSFPRELGSVSHLRGMHNNFFQITVDTGILGLTTWLGIWICFFRLLYFKATSLKPDSSERWVVIGSATTALAFLTGGIFETNFYDSEVAMLLFFIMALPFAGTQNIPKATSKV